MRCSWSSKVYPHNASREVRSPRAIEACDGLGLTGLTFICSIGVAACRLSETMEVFMALQQAGKIRYYGVSNLDIKDMQELWAVPGGSEVATDQLLYNLARRGIEWDLLPWLRERHVPVMAYSPIEQAELAFHRSLPISHADAA